MNSETKERVADVFRAVIYGGFAASGVQILVEGHTKSQKKNQESWTSTIMQHTGGRWLIGIVGVVIVAVGAYLAYEGLPRSSRRSSIRTHEPSPCSAGSARRRAASSSPSPASSRLSPRSITTRRRRAGSTAPCAPSATRPAGDVLLVIVAVGLVMFGIYGLAEAKYRRV